MKTLIAPIRFIIVLLIIGIGLPTHAKDIVYTGMKNKVDLAVSKVIHVVDPRYGDPGEGVDYVRRYTAVPALVYNRNQKTDIAGNVWSYEIEYDLLYNDPVLMQGIVKQGTLFIEHNNTEGIYEAIGIHESVVGDVQLKIRTITPVGNVPDDIHLELRLKVERYDYLDDADPITKNEMSLVSFANNQAEISWQVVDGAEYYEVEWVYWDAQHNTTTSNLASTDLETVFEKAVGIETKSNSYQFDLFYPEGLVYVRVRPVGRYIRGVNGDYNHLKYGPWVQGVDPNTNSFVILLFHGFESDRIWQVQRSFAEDAKSKQVVQYFDEGMRGRQTLTNLSSDDLTIVAENIYDAEGRPSLSTLPVPVKSLIGKNPLQFGAGTDDPTRAEGGLISTAAIDYTYKDFDKIDHADALSKVDAQGKKHVSAIYYSAENPFNNHIHRDYIPDAEDFPITQVKFLNDATGRVARQSGVGAFYQLGSNHETKYYYANPNHSELRRLFGKNVGDEKHYRKNYVVDANGQISVSYIDQAGQTIATALAGKSPDNVNTLTSEQGNTNTIASSIMGKNVVDRTAKTSVLSHAIFCDEAPRTDKFSYTLTGDGIYMPGATTSICIGCEYEVNISLIDEGGNAIPLSLIAPTNTGGGNTSPLYNGITTQVINGEIVVHYNSLYDNTCVPIPTVEVDFEAVLQNVGSYQLKKIVKVVEPDPNQLITHLENSGVLADKQTFIDQYVVDNWDPNECEYCNDAIRLRLCEQIASAEYPGYADAKITDPEYQIYFDRVQYYLLNTSTYPDCDDLRRIESLAASLKTECHAKLELIKQQIAPAGDPTTGSQGCLYTELGFWEHVYDNSNQLSLERYDANGHVVTETFSSRSDFTTFIQDQNNWQDHFVDHPDIISKHPEYCAYEVACISEVALKSRRFDFELASQKTWADAVSFGANLQTPQTVTTEQFASIIAMDPFFVAYPNYSTDMSSRLSNYCTDNYTNNPPHPTGVNGCGSGCSDVICYINNILGDPAQYVSTNHSTTINSPDITPLSDEDKWMFFRGIYAAEKAKLQQHLIDHTTGCSTGFPYTGTTTCEPIISADDTQDFMDDNGGGDPSDLTDVQAVGANVNQDNCTAICEGNARRWVNQLCPDLEETNSLNYIHLVKEFTDFCKGHCGADGDNPMGYLFEEYLDSTSSTYALDPNLPTFNQDLANAQNRLDWLMNHVPSYCGNDLVNNRLPAEVDVVFAHKTDVYEWSSVYSSGGEELELMCKDDIICAFDLLRQSSIFPTKYTDINASCPSSNNFYMPSTNMVRYYFTYGLPILPAPNCNDYINVDLGYFEDPVFSIQYLCGEGRHDYYMKFNSSNPSSFATMTFSLRDIQTGVTIDPLTIQSIGNYNSTTNTIDLTVKDNCTWTPPSSIVPNGGNQTINCSDMVANCTGGTLQVTAKVDVIKAFNDSRAIYLSFNCTSCKGGWGLKKNQLTINLDTVRIQCEEQQRAELTRKAESAYDKYLEKKLKILTSGESCMAFTESMTTEYTTTEHHYTLYYYDQAGNLIQTIPPAAVVPLPTNHFDGTTAGSTRGTWDGTDPSHDYEMTTTYAYNTLGQVVKQTSPDGGMTEFWYDYAQRLRFSQNARQLAAGGQYAYTKFDAQGRTVEVGRLDGHGVLSAWDLNKSTFPEATLAGVHERIITEYEEASFSPISQDNLRGRVARTYNDHIATYYDYDVHGNVKRLHHQISGLGASEIAYDYDLITGNVKEVAFMKGTKDQFFHRYTYDADNRLTHTQTSKNGYIWDLDAKYFYYAHGPLARVELGQDKVQGLDYVYNLQGWIKGGNNTTSESDMGLDGFAATGIATGNTIPSIANKWFGKDEAAYSLGYHRADYQPIGTGTNLGIFDHSNTAAFNNDIKGTNATKGLYNGNIAFMISHIPQLAQANPLTHATQAMVYQYDALHRITNSESYAYVNGWNKNGLSNAYRTEYTYDGNGNLQTLDRHTLENSTSTSKHIDALTYHYGSGNLKNRLESITDPSAVTAGINDVGAASYTYDEIGNLKTDGNNTIEWNLQNKVSSVDNANYDIIYTYDVGGNRLGKSVTPKGGTSPTQTTFYVRDASGNIMGTYIVENNTKKLEETPIYGSSRLGIHQYDVSLMPFNVPSITAPELMNSTLGTILGVDQAGNATRGNKFYEISNHLGNVLVTVSDQKLGEVTTIGQTTAEAYKAQVQSAQDYYPFGWEMPGRSFNSSNYKFGFNGKENDRHWGDQLIQDYGFRLYNPALGKFLSVDPLSSNYAFYSPYHFAGNCPIEAIDLDGLEALSKFKNSGNAETYSAIVTEMGKSKLLTVTYDFIGAKGAEQFPNYWNKLNWVARPSGTNPATGNSAYFEIQVVGGKNKYMPRMYADYSAAILRSRVYVSEMPPAVANDNPRARGLSGASRIEGSNWRNVYYFDQNIYINTNGYNFATISEELTHSAQSIFYANKYSVESRTIGKEGGPNPLTIEVEAKLMTMYGFYQGISGASSMSAAELYKEFVNAGFNYENELLFSKDKNGNISFNEGAKAAFDDPSKFNTTSFNNDLGKLGAAVHKTYMHLETWNMAWKVGKLEFFKKMNKKAQKKG